MLSNTGKHDTTKLGSNVVQELKINQRRILIDSLEIKIPAPEQMIALGERQLSNGVKVGQLLNSKTLNYKKLTPHRDGLFCERIFGPVQSFVCACGKKKESVQNKSKNQDLVRAKPLPPPTKIGIPEVASYQNEVSVSVQTETPFCPKCQVEYISKNVRRHRLGYIKLFAPVTHIWYLKGRPSYLSLFLGKRKKAMTSLAYCNSYLVEQVYSDLETQDRWKSSTSTQLLSERSSNPSEAPTRVKLLPKRSLGTYVRTYARTFKDRDKSFSTLVGKGNVKIWKKLSSNNLSGRNDKTQPENFFETPLTSLKKKCSSTSPSLVDLSENFDVNLKKAEMVRTDSVSSLVKGLVMPKLDFGQLRNNTKSLSNTKKDLHACILLERSSSYVPELRLGKSFARVQLRSSNAPMTSTDSGSELFLNLLIQLLPKGLSVKKVKFQYNLPELSLQDNLKEASFDNGNANQADFWTPDKENLQINKKDIRKPLLELIPLQSQRQLEKNKNDSHPITGLSFVKSERDLTLDFNRVTNWDRELVKKKDLPTFNLDRKRLRYKLSVNLKAANYSFKPASSQNIEQDQAISKQTFGNTKLLSFESHKHKISSTRYIRAQTLPFLPSLISPFHLRDCLISFLQSIPSAEDLPIPMYCQTPRRYPLRDVHKFLAEVRSTNNRKQAEKLTSESITKFLGCGQQAQKTSSLSSNFVSEQMSFPRSFVKKTPRTIFVHKPRDINFFNKNKRNAFRFANSEKRNRTLPASLLPIEDRTNTIHKIGQRVKQNIKERSYLQRLTPKHVLVEKSLSKEQNGKGVKQTQLLRARINTPVGQCVSLSTDPIRKERKIYQQKKSFLVMDQSFTLVPKVHSGSFGLQNVVSIPNREANRDKLLPKLALLPVTLHLMGNSKLVNNRFLLPFSSALLRNSTYSFKNNISKNFVLNADHFSNSYLHSERNSVELPASVQLLPQEAGISLRGALLNTFLDTVGAKLIAQSLPSTKRFWRDLGKTFSNKVLIKPNQAFSRFSFVNRKVSNVLVNVEKNRNNKLYNNNRSDSCKIQWLLPKQNKGLFSRGMPIRKMLSQFDTQLFPKLADQSTHMDVQKKSWTLLHSLKSNVEAVFKYKGKGLTYIYVPTWLYVPNPRYEKKRRVSEIVFRLTPLRYKYCSDLTVTFPSKINANTPIYNVNKKVIGQKLIVKKETFSLPSQVQDRVTVDLQNLLFRRKIETYQTRLLHIVFGTFLQDICINQLTYSKSPLTYSKSPFLHKLSEEQFVLQSTRTSLYKTYLVEKQISTNNSFPNSSSLSQYQRLATGIKQGSKKVSELGYMYLLSNHPEQQNQSREKEKVDYALLLESRKKEKGETRYKLNSNLVNPFKDSILDNKNQLSVKRYQNSPLMRKRTGTKFSRDKNWFSSSVTPPTSLGSETISKWQTNGAKEILLYTGGGALESLLKRFNTSLFCQFLLSEIQIIRKHYRDQIVAENKKRTARVERFDSLANLQKQSFDKNNPSYLNVPDSNIVTSHTLNPKEQQLGLKSVVTDKVANLFCRRIFRTTRRLKIVQLLMRSQRRPEWMMISILPVLPPDLRPVLQMGDNLIVASDLNTLYQRVIYRNNRHYKGRFLDFHFVSSIHRLVQDAVDRLIENGKGGSTPFLTPGGRPLKSLSDILKGKRGRFRFNLLGKRVDFSGRSVIVVSPNLKIHECGLPREMALELYKYLLIRQLILQKRVSSIVNAKKVIKQRKSFIWDILRQIIYYHPLLLNRAPTLHRLGIQAFQPKLSLGNAILLHPLVCAGFNADFDGDQMGVHLPLSPQARAEAWDLLWSRNNLLSPATGQPILLPSQDMVLGFYYMTSLLPYATTNKNSLSYKPCNKNEQIKSKISSSNNLVPQRKSSSLLTKPNLLNSSLVTGANLTSEFLMNSSLKSSYNSEISNQRYTDQIDLPVLYVFSDHFQVLHAYQKKQIDIHTPIWLKWGGKSENGESNQIPLELRIDTFGNQTQIYPTHQLKNKMYKDTNKFSFSFHVRTTVGRVLVNNVISKNH